MNDRYMYVFVRTDLTKRQQMVQTNHASFLLGNLVGEIDGIPNLVMIGVKNQEELKKVLTKLEEYQLPHRPYVEPDWDLGLTSIATVPLDQEQKKYLAEYKSWR